VDCSERPGLDTCPTVCTMCVIVKHDVNKERDARTVHRVHVQTLACSPCNLSASLRAPLCAPLGKNVVSNWTFKVHLPHERGDALHAVAGSCQRDDLDALWSGCVLIWVYSFSR
jgi:hypothetical protein